MSRRITQTTIEEHGYKVTINIDCEYDVQLLGDGSADISGIREAVRTNLHKAVTPIVSDVVEVAKTIDGILNE